MWTLLKSSNAILWVNKSAPPKCGALFLLSGRIRRQRMRSKGQAFKPGTEERGFRDRRQSRKGQRRAIRERSEFQNRNYEDSDDDRDNRVVAHRVKPDGATTDHAGADERNAGDSAGERDEDVSRSEAINESDSRA